MLQLNLELRTPDKELFSGAIRSVTVPGKSGSFQVLHNHAAIISTLTSGSIKIEFPDKNTPPILFDITGGVIEVLNNTVSILANDITELPHRNVFLET